MARDTRPEFAERVSTGISAEQRQRLEAIGRATGVDRAVVIRWAIAEYLERHGQGRAAAPHMVAVS